MEHFIAEYGVMGTVLVGVIIVVGTMWRMLDKHQVDCNEKAKVINDSLATGSQRMTGMEDSLARGTEKMDMLTSGQQANGESIARIDERTRLQGDAIVRVEKSLDRLIGFHERNWSDRGD